MKTVRSILSALFSTGTLGFGLPATADERILLKEVAIDEANYCHFQFASFEEDTLAWANPRAGTPMTTDVIDFYGPCDYDPLGKEEILAQKDERSDFGGDEDHSDD